MRRKFWLKIPLVIAFIFLAVFVIMLLWNALIPVIFNGPVISYWQAAGLLILSKLLFGRFGPRPHRNGWRRDRWRRKFEEKLAGMSPEEREKFYKERWNRYCYYPEDKVKPDNPGSATANNVS